MKFNLFKKREYISFKELTKLVQEKEIQTFKDEVRMQNIKNLNKNSLCFG